MISLRRKIGQMLMMGFSGCVINQHSPVVQWLNEHGLGGVLLFSVDLKTKQPDKNIRSREQILQLTDSLNYYASQSDAESLPLYIALDYEGGAVDRLANVPGCMKTLNAFEQASLSDERFSLEIEKMAATLHGLGFNLNFAPVVDLCLGETEGIIGKLGRSFSADPEKVIQNARMFVAAFSDYGMTCAYKHFPGHGSAVGDTHEGFVDVTDYFNDSELQPYQALLKKGQTPAMVMTAHVINRRLDPSGLPATLSYPILSGLLRQKMGFEGVIVSDDLQMRAISNHYSLDQALKMTINAGADLLIFGNQLAEISATEVVDRIEQLVEDRAIDPERIEQSYQRISQLKKHFLLT